MQTAKGQAEKDGGVAEMSRESASVAARFRDPVKDRVSGDFLPKLYVMDKEGTPPVCV